MAKSDKTDDQQSKGSKKAVTMRERIEGTQAKEDKKATKKPTNVVATKNKKATAKDVTKAKREADLQERGFIGSFFWGFTLPIRWIWKPIAWLFRHIVPRYFKESWKELKQVTWPSTKDTFRLTFIVLLFSLVFGGLIAGVDYGLDKIFKALILK